MEGGEVLVKDIICVSLFNGMGCSFQAIDRVSGLRCVQKISSEIDKYANIVNDANYPETIQLGSVTDIEVLKEDGVAVGLKGGNGVEVMFEKGVDILFVGGSPCTDLSLSGKRKGLSTKDKIEVLTLEHYLQLKSEKYEFDGQSYLFWEFIRLREEIKPKYYLLENVEMGEKWEKVLSKAVGVNGIHINSALVSAQSRKRIYWINFGMRPMGLFGDMQSIVEQPKDRGILLKDILEEEVDEKYFLSEKMLNYFDKRAANYNNGKVNIRNNDDKASTITASYSSCDISDNFIKVEKQNPDIIVHNTLPRSSKTGKGGTGPLKRVDGKTYCLDTGRTNVVEFKCAAMRGRGENNEQVIEERKDDKTNCLTTVSKDNLIYLLNTTENTIFANNKNIYERESKDRSNKILPTMRSIIGKETDGEWQMAIYARFFKNEILFNELSFGIIQEECKTPYENKNGESASSKANTDVSMQYLQDKRWKRCSSHRQKSTKQFIREFAKALQELPHPNTQEYKSLQDMWRETQRFRILRKALSEVQKIREPIYGETKPIYSGSRIRRLTPLEAKRLQTVADDYKMPVSSSQSYKMLGNGWNIETIVHLFNYITLEK
jgi:site-specific DNA-cytosine methylase